MSRFPFCNLASLGILAALGLPTLAHAQAATDWESWVLEPMPSESFVASEDAPEFFGFLRIYDETSHGPGFVAGADPELQALRILIITLP